LLWGGDSRNTRLSAAPFTFLKKEKFKGDNMKGIKILRNSTGKIGYLLLWLLGIPIPILIIIYLLRGCT
jgi:hypothetical protein